MREKANSNKRKGKIEQKKTSKLTETKQKTRPNKRLRKKPDSVHCI